MKSIRMLACAAVALAGAVALVAAPAPAAETAAVSPAAAQNVAATGPAATTPAAVAAAPQGTVTGSKAAAAAAGTGYWHAVGSQLVDSTGAPVRMTGVNWFGAETANYTPHGLWTRNYKDMLDQMAGLGYNTLRLPYANQLFDAGSAPNSIDYAKNPDLQGLGGLQILDKIIDYAGTKGMKVFLDQHRPDSGAQSALWYTSAYPETRWISDWTMLAKRYAGNSTVIGADLHNEPHSIQGGGGACWGCGDTATDWRLAAEKAGNAILAANPDWLIIVEGVDCVSGTGDPQCGWWGGNLSGVKDNPVRLSKQDKLVYSTHEYATSVFQQTWFSDPAFPANMPALWDHFFGYLQKGNVAPVLIGEFGSTLSDPRDKVWLQELMKYAGTGTSGINFTCWSWNPDSGDTGGILNDDWTTVNQAKQNILQPYLISPKAGSGSGGPTTNPPATNPAVTKPPATNPPTTPTTPSPSSGSCAVSYHVDNSWSTGFTATVTLRNTGAASLDGWVLNWTAPSGTQITNGWNATVSQSGQKVSARAAAWTSGLGAGASASFGFQGTGPATAPGGFAVGNSACTS